ncbi:MAG: VWA domain-containing protein [Betaproteobacteria bacterium]|nr:VWA domain-containing protein [Betaproteobacteria bacterium]
MPAGTLAPNIVHFARGLRRAGLPIGSGQILDALRAAELVGVEERDDFYWGLASILTDRHAQLELFDAAFRYFWEQKPFVTEASGRDNNGNAEGDEISRRVAEAFTPRTNSPRPEDTESLDATFTASREEQLRAMDFQSMSAQDIREAKRMLARLRLPIPEIKTRRSRPDPRGPRVDLRATLRASLRGQGELLLLAKRSPRLRHPPLVVLCDISGSMNSYSEMLLHFLHAITNDRDRVHVFLFGTRLTNVTRALRHRDVEAALGAVSCLVADWSGGTRIGTSLREFNQRWSRRVLGQNAVVLIITDGLERDGGEVLSEAMERLHKSCRKLLWLNPLLRYDGFKPLAQGVRLMLPHVDEFRPAHNVSSLMDLAHALSPDRAATTTRTTQRWK